jgi:hypothetical protein
MRVRFFLPGSSRGLVATEWPTDAFVSERRRRLRSYNTRPSRSGFTASSTWSGARRRRKNASKLTLVFRGLRSLARVSLKQITLSVGAYETDRGTRFHQRLE